jgi:DNA-binding CsgD family transcriptional regulator
MPLSSLPHILKRPAPARTGHCEASAEVLRQGLPHASSKHARESSIQVLLERLDLTPRQAEVLHWIAEGKTNAEIAVILECSFFTVKNHTKEIFQRLGVHSRVGAAACAYRCHFSEAGPSAPPPAQSRRKMKSPSRSKSL